MSVPRSVLHESLSRRIRLFPSFSFFWWFRVVETQHTKSTVGSVKIQIVLLGWVGCWAVGAQNAKRSSRVRGVESSIPG